MYPREAQMEHFRHGQFLAPLVHPDHNHVRLECLRDARQILNSAEDSAARQISRVIAVVDVTQHPHADFRTGCQMRGDLLAHRGDPQEKNTLKADGLQNDPAVKYTPRGNDHKCDNAAEDHRITGQAPLGSSDIRKNRLGQKGKADHQADMLNQQSYRLDPHVGVKILEIKAESNTNDHQDDLDHATLDEDEGIEVQAWVYEAADQPRTGQVAKENERKLGEDQADETG